MNQRLVAACLLIAALPASVAAEALSCTGARPDVKRAFFGDLHVHTSFSIDAYAVGIRVDPADAYAFAKGQELTLSDRRTRTRLERPLDFAAVTYHAEYFDVSYLCGDPTYSGRDWCSRFREASQPDPQIQGFRKFALPLFAGPKSLPAPLCEAGGECRQARQSQWGRVRSMANEANEPCRFTAFVANEWSATPNARHWHRNLIYASDKVPDYPINVLDQPDLHTMWTALDQQCKAGEGCDVVAIPHNMNLAEGGGFDIESEDELSLRLRARFERVAEIYQHKGASECLSDWSRRGEDDCSFELMFPARFGGPFGGKVDQENWNRMRSTYYRSLLARGLQMQQRLRFNPLQLGAVASTDTHNGTPGAVEEGAWLGHFGSDLNPSARFSLFPDASPGGLVGIWAEENTRQSLFAGLKRREVFGTSGPRIVVRFFALPAGAKDPCLAGDPPANAVPMGGELPGGTRFRPVFVVQALMDREPLEKIQVVTGVLGPKGIEERVVDLVPSSGAGGASLCAVHREPRYDANRPAYWYARVIERPTKRWSKRDCEAAGRCSPAQDRMVSERAWSSPIWRLP